MDLKLRHWILDDHNNPKEVDLMTWALWFKDPRRKVADDMVCDVWVSTIFLGIDHNFAFTGPPILWETMAFGPEEWSKTMERVYRPEVAIDRCAGSWEQALTMHQQMIERMVKEHGFLWKQIESITGQVMQVGSE